MKLTFWAKTKIPRNKVQKSDSYIRENWCINNRRKLFWWKNMREKDHLEDPGVDGRKMLG
jgi:hypothetical protein